MPNLTYIEANGTAHTVQANEGTNLMEIAVANLIPGILGDCGGSCSCATCHTYVDPGWMACVPAATDEELEILDGALDVRENSRLACQVFMSNALDGLIVRIPERQF
ncbi:2Fe-2S iron-sulfur cluster-binding protein [Pseudomonas sp. GD03860]|uniref:2Fe-2S iron-sulfur cluster-binding protein n=1 Tax=Pseudomonas TaxID=286 RepID=UPI00236449E3|nr:MULTISPECIES: 2Fe-2S iron-sulfur cluster-binding protein [Pseudomonas]MDD2058403.1 2Fe-2S iron-sulfur cluster-binding protein [Pseudomonas putida]MDH0640215.1 2Fe-2S iron-sulfur cluster-binding protein [Pseudomonas sp. GD03860]